MILFLNIQGCIQTENQKKRFVLVMPMDHSKKELNSLPDGWRLQAYGLQDNGIIVLDVPVGDDWSDVEEFFEKKGQSFIGFPVRPLERIYKLEQKEVYTAEEGQLIYPVLDAKRYVLTLEIVNDLEMRDEYKRIHAMGMAWPEITQNMKTVGVKDMEIYMNNYQAYLIMDTKKDFDMISDGDKWSRLPREFEWQVYVSRFQKVDPESRAIEKWREMQEIELTYPVVGLR